MHRAVPGALRQPLAALQSATRSPYDLQGSAFLYVAVTMSVTGSVVYRCFLHRCTRQLVGCVRTRPSATTVARVRMCSTRFCQALPHTCRA